VTPQDTGGGKISPPPQNFSLPRHNTGSLRIRLKRLFSGDSIFTNYDSSD
jgi:hypothetical protein